MAEKNFEINIYIQNLDSDTKKVYFKIDGRRFPTSNKTLKFVSGSKYEICVETKPNEIKLDSMTIGGCSLTLQPKDNRYICEWYTGDMELSKKGKRSEVHLSLQGPCGNMLTSLMCKFYSSTDTHVQWGTPLSFIKFKCSAENGVIKVIDEQFR